MGLSTAPAGYTAAALLAATPDAIPRLWNEKLRRTGAQTDNPFRQWAAVGDNNATVEGLSGAPLCIINDLSKMGGERVTFTAARSFNAPATLGETTLMGKERSVKFGTYDVYVDDVRVATAWTKKEVRKLMKSGQFEDFVIQATDRNLGLIQRDFIMQRLRERSTLGRNLIFPTSTRSSIQALQSTDVASTDVIARAAGVLTSIGGKPITARKLKNGAKVPNYLFFGPSEVLNSLYSDTSYQNAANYAQNRGDENTQFAGGFVDWRGQKIWHWNVVDEDISGPIGSMFNPKAALGVAIAAGTTAVVIRGGGAGYDASEPGGALDYFRHFPGGSSIGKQYEDESRSSDTSSHFIVAVVQTGADAGKWCMYRYQANDNVGTAITVAAYSATAGLKGGRLSATAATGSADDECGYVAWNAAIHTEDILQGSLLYHANAYGQIIGYIGALGSDAILLAHGGGAAGTGQSFAFDPKSVRSITSLAGAATGQLLGESDDYGMKAALAAHGVFGCDVPKDSLGRYTNHVMIPCVYTPAAGGVRYS